MILALRKFDVTVLKTNLVVNNTDNRVFIFRNYRSNSCPLEI